MDYQIRIDGKAVAAFALLADAIGFAKRRRGPCKIYSKGYSPKGRVIWRVAMIIESDSIETGRAIGCRSVHRAERCQFCAGKLAGGNCNNCNPIT